MCAYRKWFACISQVLIFRFYFCALPQEQGGQEECDNWLERMQHIYAFRGAAEGGGKRPVAQIFGDGTDSTMEIFSPEDVAAARGQARAETDRYSQIATVHSAGL